MSGSVSDLLPADLYLSRQRKQKQDHMEDHQPNQEGIDPQHEVELYLVEASDGEA
jgi:hypothetical protein